MTSPAIKLARECDAKQEFDFVGDAPLMAFCETFYAKSQAQALRNAADDYHKDCDCTDYLRRMAGDLEAGK